jgi:hypothetical protein
LPILKLPNDTARLDHHLLKPILEKPPHGLCLMCVQRKVEIEVEVRRRYDLHPHPTGIEQAFQALLDVAPPWRSS